MMKGYKTKSFVRVLTLSFSAGFLFLLNTEPASAAFKATMTAEDMIVNIATSGEQTATAVIKNEVTAITNCEAGFTVQISTSESPRLFLGGVAPAEGDEDGKVINPVSGTATLGENEWGYTLIKPESGDIREGNFTGLTTSGVSIKTYEEEDITVGESKTLSVYYGVKVSQGTAVGTYTMTNGGAIVYQGVVNPSCANYQIEFHSNYGSVDSTMTDVTETQEAYLGQEDILEWSTIPAPSKGQHQDNNGDTVGVADKLWVLWGWNTEEDGTGDWYKDGGTINLSDTDGVDTSTPLVLYAQWKQATLYDMTQPTTTVTGTKTITNDTMQDMKPGICYNSNAYTTSGAGNTPYNPSSAPNGYHSVTLTDSRGRTTGVASYTVTKFDDGVCWMTTDLYLGNSETNVALTPHDTDITEDFTLPMSSSSYYTTTDSTNINQAYNLLRLKSSTWMGYYTYAAATADTNTYSKGNEVVTTSICPKHWDLPMDHHYLAFRNKVANSAASPYNFNNYGGYRNAANGFYNDGSQTYYWTSKNVSTTTANWAYASSSGIQNSGSAANKFYGAKVRCVAEQGTATVSFDGNGSNEYPVSGEMATLENVDLNTTITGTEGFTRTGWKFNGWNTEADGTGRGITGTNASSTPLSYFGIAPGETVTLYAQWLPQYKITYVNNCASYVSNTSVCSTTTSNGTQEQWANLDELGNGSALLKNYNAWTNVSGYKILEWTTNPGPTDLGTTYARNSTFNITGASAGDGITLYAHWVPVYSLIYDGNGADSASTDGTMTNIKHTNVAEGDYLDLFASNYSRAGYGFAGWSLDQIATTSASSINTAVANGTFKIYGPNEVFNPGSNYAGYADSNKNVTLYAVWVAPETGVTMQTFNPTATTYANMAEGSIIALRDARDDEVYTIGKLADGNWWMVENLRLDNTATLSADNTRNPVIAALSAPTNSWCTNTNSTCYDQSILNVWNTLHATAQSGTSYTSYNYTPSMTDSINQSNTATSPSHQNSLNAPIYSYGNYYNWYSATAGNGTYSKSSGNVAGDICPTGWHLPYGASGTGTGGGNTSGGFYWLGSKLGATSNNNASSQKWRKYPNNFVYSGNWNSSSASNRGNNANYWSSTANNSNYAYTLYLNSSYLYPGTSNGVKYYGFTVRCVAGS